MHNHNNIPASYSPQQQQAPQPVESDPGKAYKYIAQMQDVEHREDAITQLSKLREEFKDLAIWLWYSTSTIAVLLQEIMSVYPLLTPPTMQTAASNRVSNSLALLQCIASHEKTRKQLIDSGVVLYLYPFLSNQDPRKPFEYLRLTSLGVIGALVKADDETVVTNLLKTDIVPLCLRIMEHGTELSQTVATFVLHRVMNSKDGLDYMCQTPERFTAVAKVLTQVVQSKKDMTARLLKLVIKCFTRLADHAHAKNEIARVIPAELRNNTFGKLVDDDPSIKKAMMQLLKATGDVNDGRRNH
jgi:CCR4-NOT transcription complex subunit 9